ncbi:MAG: hypothetical protein AAGD35_07225 [Actinomycetota bacterium]
MSKAGASVGEMNALVGRFTAAGATFQTESGNIMTRVQNAVDAFGTTMNGFHQRGTVLSGQMQDHITSLETLSNGTTWEGGNSEEETAILADMVTGVKELRAALDAFLGEAKAVVEGSLTENLTEVSTQVGKYGNKAQETATSFGTGVGKQMTAFETVLN